MKIFGEHDRRVIEQLARCQAAEEGSLAVLCADGHLGYSQPIGGAVAYREHISPSGVGYDIGCGNKAVRTNIHASDLIGMCEIKGIMDEIVARISFGVGRKNDEPVDHPVLDKIAEAPFKEQRSLADLARKQLGTVGAGNHYVDLFADQDDWLWIGVHFGSRGFGHKTASGFLALAAGKGFTERAIEGEMDSPPIVFRTDSELGQSYIEAMQLAGEYAYAGRDVVVDKVLSIIGASEVEQIHNHHNFAWQETHNGEQWWVVRKGCTPAFPNQQGFVGASMGEEAVILEGTNQAHDALFSTVHGAGRAMSRTEAVGKIKRRKIWECSERDCEYQTKNSEQPCPSHSNRKLIKRHTREQVRPGRIDWEAVIADLSKQGIELRGGAADEAPGAYKRLNQVLAEHGDTIRVTHRLRPLGVAMASADTFDPFKD